MKFVSGSLAALAFLFAGIAAHAQTDPANAPAAGAGDVNWVQGVRIVRLSQVKGEVHVDRNVDRGFEPAFANLPITQGTKLMTGNGVAEVELEDNSTLRLTPDTTIEFTDLRRAPSGLTTSTVNVVGGTVFVSLAPTRGNQFTVTSKQGTLVLTPSTRVHFHVGSPKTTAAVLEGSVEAEVGANKTIAYKKTTLLFDPANQAAPTLVSHLDKDPYDAWDKSAVDYHRRYMNTGTFGNGGYPSQMFGAADMNYYGSFSSIGSCGSMWRPYLASASWDPYANGILAYYPSAGYSWVSPYPWGWTPYNSGSWINCPGVGWGWQPGGGFGGLANVSAPVMSRHGILPIAPPKHGHGTLLAVHAQPLVASQFKDGNTFVFAKDSAGLGVPRETFGKLSKISSNTQRDGFAAREAYSAPASASARTGQSGVSFIHSGPSLSMSRSASSSLGGSSVGASGFASSSVSSVSSASFSSASAGAAHGAGSSGGGGAHH